MTLKQLENLIEIDQDITDDAYGTYYDKRTIEQLLNNGIILLDKPPIKSVNCIAPFTFFVVTHFK